MCDISDITAYLKGQALAAVYPNGVGANNSVAGMDVRIYEGWPVADQLELDVGGKTLIGSANGEPITRPNGPCANVSIFPMTGGGHVYQILNETYTISAPVINLKTSLDGDTLTVTSGTPATGEFITVICDDAHIYSKTGATVADILAAIAGAAQFDYPAAIATATTLTIPVEFSMVVRQGGVGVLGKVTNRQKQGVMVTVWAPTPESRTTLAAAIDNVIKQTIKPSMPDTSQAIVTYRTTIVADDKQTVTIYRRDLIYDIEYATVEQFPGVTITSTQVSITNPSNTAIATAVE